MKQPMFCPSMSPPSNCLTSHPVLPHLELLPGRQQQLEGLQHYISGHHLWAGALCTSRPQHREDKNVSAYARGEARGAGGGSHTEVTVSKKVCRCRQPASQGPSPPRVASAEHQACHPASSCEPLPALATPDSFPDNPCSRKGMTM